MSAATARVPAPTGSKRTPIPIPTKTGAPLHSTRKHSPPTKERTTTKVAVATTSPKNKGKAAAAVERVSEIKKKRGQAEADKLMVSLAARDYETVSDLLDGMYVCLCIYV